MRKWKALARLSRVFNTLPLVFNTHAHTRFGELYALAHTIQRIGGRDL
jgi:hypothetical protein